MPHIMPLNWLFIFLLTNLIIHPLLTLLFLSTPHLHLQHTNPLPPNQWKW
uniref:ATP synthase F0 subunit 8 n=1 Tax=Linguatula arctica TaxID=1346601 RepID=A0A7G8QC90_9CRUS|nr:ATP synthase F0 subunit 8 [Linguatula arctica]QNK04398.1 ATP synthase F0 subunit 8 [Linguatula arctica]